MRGDRERFTVGWKGVDEGREFLSRRAEVDGERGFVDHFAGMWGHDVAAKQLPCLWMCNKFNETLRNAIRYRA